MKRSSLFGVLLACMASTTFAQATYSDDADTVDRHATCREMGVLAEHIMEARQAGIALETMMRIVVEVAEKMSAGDEFEEDISRGAQPRNLSSMGEEMVLRAFEYPRVSGEARNELAVRFRDEIVLDCYRMF